MKLKLSYLFLIFLFIPPAFSQNSCLYKDVKELEQDYAKNKKKVIQKFDGKGNMAYFIADCYRLNNDSSCYHWYRNAANDLKVDYSKENDKKKKAMLLYRIGFAYYYMSDFKQAEVYFHKAIKAKIDDPQAFYYLGVCLFKQQKWKEAHTELSEWKKNCMVCFDADEMMKQCVVEMGKEK